MNDDRRKAIASFYMRQFAGFTSIMAFEALDRAPTLESASELYEDEDSGLTRALQAADYVAANGNPTDWLGTVKQFEDERVAHEEAEDAEADDA